MKISFFETRTRNSFFQSRASRREREFLFSISCFETRTRNRKSFLMVEREKIRLILTRIPGIENSRYALVWIYGGMRFNGVSPIIFKDEWGGTQPKRWGSKHTALVQILAKVFQASPFPPSASPSAYMHQASGISPFASSASSALTKWRTLCSQNTQ